MTPLNHKPLLATLLLALLVTSVNAQEDQYARLKSVDGIIESLYGSISGEAGVPRDWNLFRSLFHPEAKLMPTGLDSAQNRVVNFMTPAQFIEQADAFFLEQGFFEIEVHRVTEEYGPMVHLFSTYESRRSESDPAPYNRGINSIQLFHDGNRWWVMSIFWAHEPNNEPLPSKYLPGDE